MVLHNLSGFASDRKVKPANAVDVSARATHQSPQFGSIRRRVHDVVEFQISIVKAFEVVPFGAAI